MGDRYCITCGQDMLRAYDPPIACEACEMAERYERTHVREPDPASYSPTDPSTWTRAQLVAEVEALRGEWTGDA